jgi:hypothetical protein
MKPRIAFATMHLRKTATNGPQTQEGGGRSTTRGDSDLKRCYLHFLLNRIKIDQPVANIGL